MPKKYKVPTIEELFDAGVHYGHQTKKWHPGMESYIFAAKKNMHIIDLEQTHSALEEVCEFLYDIAKLSGEIIFVGTKKQAKELIKTSAEECGVKYVNERWLGGTLTNFNIIRKSIDRLLSHLKHKDEGSYAKYTKKERLLIDREIAKLQIHVGGIVGLTQKPKALFIIDAKRERTAIKEAKLSKVAVLGLVDTNSDPRGVDFVIPGNDDAIRSIGIIMSAVSEAISAGYAAADSDDKPVEKKVESKVEKKPKTKVVEKKPKTKVVEKK